MATEKLRINNLISSNSSVMSSNQTEKVALEEWLFDDCDEFGYTYRCSGCGHLIFVAYRLKNIPKPDECTRCGSKMKGE